MSPQSFWPEPKLYKKMQLFKIHTTILLVVLMFSGAAGTDRAAHGDYEKLFPAVAGWEMTGDIDVYDWESLWDIINGAAELYYAYDFQEMYWGRYSNPDDDGTYIVMEIYRQGNPVMAFGVYSQERPRPPRLVEVGAEGFAAPGALHFFVSDLYVRMRSHDTSPEIAETMENLARKVSDIVEARPTFPEITRKLPAHGRVPFSEQFIQTNFLGHSFLSGAFVSSYEISGKRFNLFVIEHENGEQCRKMLADYYQFSRQDTDDITEGIHLIEDRWNGEVGIVWQDHFLYGFYNLENPELQQTYFEMFSGN